MLIDYAHPMIQAEHYQKVAHDALLMRDLTAGKELLLNAIAELRLACIAIDHLIAQERK